MKKILFVSPTGTYDNGAEISIVNFMAYLSGRGHRVVNVFQKNPHPTYERYLKEMESSGIQFYPLETKFWWWPEFNIDMKRYSKELMYQYQDNISDIRNIIKKEAIDIVVTNTVNQFQGAVAAALEGIPHVYLLHEYPSEEFAYYKAKIPFIIENSDAVFTASHHLAETLFSDYHFPEKPKSFLPYSPLKETTDDVEVEGETSCRIVTVGKINERKNQLELLKAYQQLGRYDIPLVLIGGWDEDYKQICDEFVENHHLANVHFLGNQANPWSLVTDKDICVLTSKQETFSMVMIESAINAIPLIYSNIHGHQSVYQYFHNGTAYELGNIDQLAEQLASYIEQFSSIKEEAVINAEKSRQIYTIENAYKELVNYLESSTEPKHKSISDVATLFHRLGFTENELLLEKIDTEEAKVYFATEGESFTEEQKIEFSLNQKGEFEFEVPVGTQQIRIDLSETASYYSKISLKAATSGEELQYSDTNALYAREVFAFIHPDPNITYQVQPEMGHTFRLQYEKIDYRNLREENYIGKKLSAELVYLSHVIQDKDIQLEEYKKVSIQLEECQKALAQLQYDYNCVVTSRRWTIPTKIMNFFRRRK